MKQNTKKMSKEEVKEILIKSRDNYMGLIPYQVNVWEMVHKIQQSKDFEKAVYALLDSEEWQNQKYTWLDLMEASDPYQYLLDAYKDLYDREPLGNGEISELASKLYSEFTTMLFKHF